MQLTVKIVLGRECEVEISPTATVRQLKHEVSKLLDIDMAQQRLLFKGKILADENPLSFYPGIKHGSMLNLMEIIEPGMHLLKNEIGRVLRLYYTEAETKEITKEVLKDLRNEAQDLSFEDLERLATTLFDDHLQYAGTTLQDQGNVA